MKLMLHLPRLVIIAPCGALYGLCLPVLEPVLSPTGLDLMAQLRPRELKIRVTSRLYPGQLMTRHNESNEYTRCRCGASEARALGVGSALRDGGVSAEWTRPVETDRVGLPTVCSARTVASPRAVDRFSLYEKIAAFWIHNKLLLKPLIIRSDLVPLLALVQCFSRLFKFKGNCSLSQHVILSEIAVL